MREIQSRRVMPCRSNEGCESHRVCREASCTRAIQRDSSSEGTHRGSCIHQVHEHSHERMPSRSRPNRVDERAREAQSRPSRGAACRDQWYISHVPMRSLRPVAVVRLRRRAILYGVSAQSSVPQSLGRERGSREERVREGQDQSDRDARARVLRQTVQVSNRDPDAVRVRNQIRNTQVRSRSSQSLNRSASSRFIAAGGAASQSRTVSAQAGPGYSSYRCRRRAECRAILVQRYTECDSSSQREATCME
uniref:Uncharacterized protein n=1 Tax=Knipowitschia caucasica TaxID=637954 RepID=A0AAV2KWU7_KNICA